MSRILEIYKDDTYGVPGNNQKELELSVDHRPSDPTLYTWLLKIQDTSFAVSYHNSKFYLDDTVTDIEATFHDFSLVGTYSGFRFTALKGKVVVK